LLGQCLHLREAFQIHTNTQHMADPRLRRGRHHRLEIATMGVKIQAIQMAMGIHKRGSSHNRLQR